MYYTLSSVPIHNICFHTTISKFEGFNRLLRWYNTETVSRNCFDDKHNNIFYNVILYLRIDK